MFFRNKFALSFLILLFPFQAISQQEIIDKVFASKPKEFLEQIEIIDTLDFNLENWRDKNGDMLRTFFGSTNPEYFFVYRHKQTLKEGLIIYNEQTSHFTEPICDSIYFLNIKGGHVVENANYVGKKEYRSDTLNFIFCSQNESNELWQIAYVENDSSFSSKKIGEIEKDKFKLVKFNQLLNEYNEVVEIRALFLNVRTLEIVNSSVINSKIVANEAVPIDYYDGEANSMDIESRLYYSPIEIWYILSDDTISDVFCYKFLDVPYETEELIPESWNGIWNTTANVGIVKTSGTNQTIIIENNQMTTAFGIGIGSGNWNLHLSEIDTLNLIEVMIRSKVDSAAQKVILENWIGSDTNIRFLAFSGYQNNLRYREFYLMNDQNLLYFFYELSADDKIKIKYGYYYPEKVHSKKIVISSVQNGRCKFKDEAGNEVQIPENFNERYHFNETYVDDKYIDSDHNLVFCVNRDSNARAFEYGMNYPGKIEILWIGDSTYNINSEILSVKQAPFKILDQYQNILAEGIISLDETGYRSQLYFVTNISSQMGLLSKVGEWIIRPEYSRISIVTDVYCHTQNYDLDYEESDTEAHRGDSQPTYLGVEINGKIGLTGLDGQIIVPIEFDAITVCGKFAITFKDDLMGVYSLAGKKILENEYLFFFDNRHLAEFWALNRHQNGINLLSKEGKLALFDSEFNQASDFQYTSLSETSPGYFIAVKENKKYGLINSKNETQIEFDYDYIQEMNHCNSSFIVSKDTSKGVISPNGEVIVPVFFESIISDGLDWSKNIILARNFDNSISVFDTTGTLILEKCPYENFDFYSEYTICRCRVDGVSNYYDRNGVLFSSMPYFDLENYWANTNLKGVSNDEGRYTKYGVQNSLDSTLLLPIVFDYIFVIAIESKVFFIVEIDGRYGVYSSSGKQLVKLKWYEEEDRIYDHRYYSEISDKGKVEYFVEFMDKRGRTKAIELKD